MKLVIPSREARPRHTGPNECPIDVSLADMGGQIGPNHIGPANPLLAALRVPASVVVAPESDMVPGHEGLQPEVPENPNNLISLSLPCPKLVHFDLRVSWWWTGNVPAYSAAA